MMRLFFLVSLFTVSAVFGQNSSDQKTITLEDSFIAALKYNEGAKQTDERVIQSNEQLTQAKSTIYPNLSLNATYLKQPKASDPVARDFFPDEQTTVNAQVKQPLFRGLREFAAVRQRKDFVAAEEQGRLAFLLNLYEQTSGAYLNILAMEQDLKNLNQQLEIYGNRVKDLQGRVRRGESSSSESLTAQSTQASLDAEIRLVQSNLRTARENFQVMTGLPADSQLVDIAVGSDKAVVPLADLKTYLARIEERPDIKSAKVKAEASEEDIKIARGGHLPNLDLIGNYYFKRPDGITSDLKWDVQLQFTLPLFEGGLRNSQTREAASKSRQSESELRRLRKQAEADIKSIYDGLKSRGAQIEALKKSSEIAEKNYQVLTRDSRRGLVRSIDVQLALTEYRMARRSYDQSRYQAKLDQIRLNLASAQFPDVLVKEQQ